MTALDHAAPYGAMPLGRALARPGAVRSLEVILYLLILTSFFTFVQPSPYEILVLPLLIACFAARVTLDLKVMPLIVLLLVLEGAGLVSLVPVLDDSDAVKFMAISIYLALTAMIFAWLFTDDCMRRIAIVRSAYVLSAVIAAILGIVGYFQLFPGAEIFTMNDRAVSTFKDPNIFGPFLILPLLLLVERFIAGIVRVRYIVAGSIILVGLLLAFSRAAWGHFVVSAIVMLALLFVTSADMRLRGRLIVFTVAALVGLTALIVGLLSIEEVREMFLKRATLLQEYDIGTSGARFSIQALSIEEILNHPNGMGPWVFAKNYGLVSHNSYLGTMLNHGWIGGMAYLALVLSTLALGFRALLVRTPWQPVLVATYATFFGLALESLVVDTDHWRHYYLLVGMIWGLAVATINAQRRQARMPAFAQAAPAETRAPLAGRVHFRL